MIKLPEKMEYSIVFKRYMYLITTLIFSELFLVYPITHLMSDYKYIFVYSFACLGMVLLFIRQDYKENMLFAYKREKLRFIRVFLFLKFTSEYIPARFVISHLYSYFALLVGITLIIMKINLNYISSMSVGNFTLILIIILNLIPFILFSIIEGIENRNKSE